MSDYSKYKKNEGTASWWLTRSFDKEKYNDLHEFRRIAYEKCKERLASFLIKEGDYVKVLVYKSTHRNYKGTIISIEDSFITLKQTKKQVYFDCNEIEDIEILITSDKSKNVISLENYKRNKLLH